VATGINVNQAITIVERCAVKSIELPRRRQLQFDTAKTEAALFTRKQGQKKHLRLEPTARIKVGNGFIRFNKEATRWLGIWMDVNLIFKEHHNRCMKKAMAADARVQTLAKTYDVIPESIRAVQVACIRAVALYGSEVCWDPKEIGRRDAHQMLFNRRARSVLSALSMTPSRAQIRESGLTPVPVILDSRQQRFAARLTTACSTELK